MDFSSCVVTVHSLLLCCEFLIWLWYSLSFFSTKKTGLILLPVHYSFGVLSLYLENIHLLVPLGCATYLSTNRSIFQFLASILLSNMSGTPWTASWVGFELMITVSKHMTPTPQTAQSLWLAAMYIAVYNIRQFMSMQLHEIQHVFIIHNLAYKDHATRYS